MSLSDFPNVKRLLIDQMDREKAAQLQDYFQLKRPDPRWLESLLEILKGNVTLDNALKLIRDDPSQTIAYGSNLDVAAYYSARNLGVEFLDTSNSLNYDLKVDSKIAMEVKLMEDVSNWTRLSRRSCRYHLVTLWGLRPISKSARGNLRR
jgi:hypothetical protein